MDPPKSWPEVIARGEYKLYDYNGMTMIPMFPAASLDKIKETIFHDEDIIVATYPKCGTTWMQQIVLLLQNDGDGRESENIPMAQRWQFIEEISADGKTSYDAWASSPPPHLVKTHLHPDFYRKTFDNSKTKFIVVLRNPKDALVSYYNFYKIGQIFQFSGNWDDFFQLFKDKKLVHGDVFDIQLNWWRMRRDPRVEVFTFEDMLKSPEENIRRVMKLMGKSLPDDVVQSIVHKTSFKSMKENPLTNYSHVKGLDKKNPSAFMRKGKVGDWQNYFSKEQAAYVDKLSSELLEPEGLHLEDS